MLKLHTKLSLAMHLLLKTLNSAKLISMELMKSYDIFRRNRFIFQLLSHKCVDTGTQITELLSCELQGLHLQILGRLRTPVGRHFHTGYAIFSW